jgi:hypothetical protein
MTTAKKRPASTKKTVSKSVTAKRPVAKKAVSKPRATAVRVSKKAKMQSFKLAPREQPFLSLNPTVQTIYWAVIGAVAIVFTTWIMTLQAQIHNIYDSIDHGNAADTTSLVTTKKH